MKILSVNIANPQSIVFNGKEITTGIFKIPVERPVYLSIEGIKGDHVMDKLHHGGKDKACYLYSFDHYGYWKKLYPDLNWGYGMLGENLTVEGLNEAEIKIGDVLNIGSATVQVSQPRQPCYKLGVKFGNQQMVNDFRQAPYPGVYARVLKEGWISKNEDITLIQRNPDATTVSDLYQLIYSKNPDRKLLKAALNQPAIALRLKLYLYKKFITSLF